MRSDEQRDSCIDQLFARILILEAEIATLKGAPPAEETAPPNQFPGRDPKTEVGSLQVEQKPLTRKTSDDSLESAIGTRWIGRVGMLAILCGVAFFLKYSFDNRLIGEAGRVILGILWGASFIGGGEYFQRRKGLPLYGQMLTGGGLAVLYLALYAALALYHLIPVPLAAAGMVAVTTAGLTLSSRYSAFPLAALALLGGFLTPIMISSGINQPLTLFSYLLLLDAAALLLTHFRPWPSLAPISLLGTALLYAGWHMEFFSEPQRWLAFALISLFFSLYTVSIIVSRLYTQRAESSIDQSVILLSASFFWLAFFAQHLETVTGPVKIFTLSLAAVEIGLASFIRGKRPAALITIGTFAAVSVVLTVVAAFVALEQGWILPTLATEMAVLGWISLRLDVIHLRRGIYLLAVVVLFRFVVDIDLRLEPFEHFTPLFNRRFFSCLFAVVGFYAFLKSTWRYRDRLDKGEQLFVLGTCFIATQVLSLALLSVEVYDFFRFYSPGHVLNYGASHYAYQLSLSVLWALYASLLTGIGIIRRIRGARLLGILLLGITILKVFLSDLSALETVYRIISFVVLGILLLAVSYGYNRFKHLIFGEDQL